MKHIVIIGGGTGSFVVLRGIKHYPVRISSIVTMMDSGGSTGRLRDQLGVLPPGDLRQSLVALSDTSQLWRTLFLYRFEQGDLEGHNFGNIFLTALEKISNNYQEVIDTAAYILKTRGNVIPVTFDRVHLCATYEDGETVETEAFIDEAKHKKTRISSIFLKPSAVANPKAVEALETADMIVIGPGDLYTSLLPNIVVEGITSAIRSSSAPVTYIMNLFTKAGQTSGYKASDHIRDIEKYIERPVDFVLINEEPPKPEVVEYYAKYGEQLVKDDMQSDKRVLRVDLLSPTAYNKPKADHTMRSLLRHDPQKVALALWQLIQKHA
ncbi:MAG: Gluconeogenesis factor [Microgenomates bacterium OLB22]|nr:MAG: Gluconeogenesis factor [Microgenomates bacterium OLB22]